MRELLGLSPFSLSVVASCVRLQLRLLPSTRVTRLHQYYELLRHPSRPGLSLASCQLIPTAISAGTSRVAPDPLCLPAVAHTPAGPMETDSLVPFHRLRPSPNRRRVGPCITLFEACSAFTHVTACMLTESPMRPSTPKASAASLPPLLLRLLPGGTNQFPGGISLPLRISAFSRRTPIAALVRTGGSDAFVGGEAEADVVGGPPACGVAKLRAQGLLDFADVGSSFGGRQGFGETLRESFQPTGDIAGKRSWAGDQPDVVHDAS